MSLSNFSIKKPATTIMIVIAMVFFGLVGLSRMPIELMPNTSEPMATITIEWDGATPDDVDKMITKKVEDILPNVTGITEYTSTSELEKSQINVNFDYGTDVELKVALLQNEINQIKNDLPADIEEPRIKEQSSSGRPAIVVSLSGGGTMEMRTFANSSLEPLIERIDGVSQVLVRGGEEQEVLVEVDPERLENYNLSIQDVIDVLSQSSVNMPGGILREGQKELFVKVDGELTTPEQIGDVILKNINGNLLKVSDIANVGMAGKDKDSILRMAGNDGLSVIIIKTDDGNSIEIGNKVKEVMENLQGSLPLDTKMFVEYDSSISILNSISNVRQTAYIGIVLASIVLFIFLKSISATLVVAMAIPTSIIFTFFLLNAMGISINIISLMGLSLGVGMLVDNSVVVIDNIFRRLTEHKEDKVTASRIGSNEVVLPIIASSLTTIAVFIPIVFQTGIVKQQFGDMSYSITFCLLASFIIAVMFVPMMCSKILKTGKNLAHEGKFMKYIKRKYVHLLKISLRRRFIVVGAAAILFIGSLFMAQSLGSRFLPSQDEGRFAVIASLPSGSDINKAETVADILDREAPNIEYANEYSITGDNSDVILNINAGDKSSRDLSMYDIMADLRTRFSDVPDADITIVPAFIVRANDINDIEFNLYSDNEKQLEIISEQIKEKIVNVPGLVDISTSLEGGKPEGKFVVDREKASYYGVSVSSIAAMIKNQIQGAKPLSINSDNDEIDVTVKLTKEYRESTSLVLDTRITLDNGKNIRVSDVADFVIEEGPSQIEKKDKNRKVTIYANLERGYDITGAENSIIDALEEIGIPDGVTYESSGDGKDMANIFAQLSTTFLFAIFLIYFILVWQFESFVLPLIIVFSVPLSTMGALFGLFVAGKDLDAMVFVGIVMLVGIVVNNAIVLIDFINYRIEAGDSIPRAVVVAGKTRLRPILMTTMTTVLGMIPLAISNGEGAELYNGMAFVVVVGLTIATFLTLFLIPAIYYIIEDMREHVIMLWRNKKK